MSVGVGESWTASKERWYNIGSFVKVSLYTSPKMHDNTISMRIVHLKKNLVKSGNKVVKNSIHLEWQHVLDVMIECFQYDQALSKCPNGQNFWTDKTL